MWTTNFHLQPTNSIKMQAGTAMDEKSPWQFYYGP